MGLGAMMPNYIPTSLHSPLRGILLCVSENWMSCLVQITTDLQNFICQRWDSHPDKRKYSFHIF